MWLHTRSTCIIISTYRLNHIHCLSVIYFSLSCWKRALIKCISAIYVSEKPVSWMMVAPSLTPNKSPGVSNNPGLRLYKFNTNTGHVSICSSKFCTCIHVMVIFWIFYDCRVDSVRETFRFHKKTVVFYGIIENHDSLNVFDFSIGILSRATKYVYYI